MTWFGLGKIAVSSAGTPVPLTASSIPVKVNAIMVTYDPADGTKVVYVQDRQHNKMVSMASSTAPPVIFSGPGANQQDLRNFEIDVGTNGAGPYVAYGVE